MTLPQIGAALLRALGLLNQVISAINGVVQLLTGIQNALGEPAQQHSVEDVLTDTATIIAMLNDPVIGLAAIKGEVQAQATGILALIDGLPQVGDPVTLPTTPPAGYGADAPSTLADAVWFYHLGSGGIAGDMLANAGYLAINLSTAGAAFNGANSSWFTLSGTWFNPAGPDGPSSAPTWDPSTILPADTLLTWLNRESGNTGWSADRDGHAWNYQDPSFNDYIYTSILDEVQFQAYKAAGAIAPASLGAPIWPGVDGITYGDPTSFTDSFTITTPMDGIAVAIDSVPTETGAYDFDGQLSYGHMGSVVFFNDGDLQETYQNLGFVDAVYTPKTMVRAKGVRVRTRKGSTGRVWPWTINPT